MFKSGSIFFKLLSLLILMLISTSFCLLVSNFFITSYFDVSMQNLDFFLSDYSSKKSILALKIIQIASAFGIFIFPVLIFFKIYKMKLIYDLPNLKLVFLSILIIFLGNGMVDLLFKINQLFPLSDWMISYEENAKIITQKFLIMSSFNDLLINIFVIAILPAVGEEILFRGLIQNSLIENKINYLYSIVITAIIFSAIHMQFAGFLPRLVLGILLVYIYFVTKNIWYPIICHFFNNFLIVFISYLSQNNLIQVQLDIDNYQLSNFTAVLFLASMIYLIFYFKKEIQKRTI